MWILAWIIVSLLVAMMATDKSVGFWGALIISLLLSPIVGIIVVAVSPNKNEPVTEKKESTEKAAQVNSPIAMSEKTVEDRINNLNYLLEKELITKEEYDIRRQKVLDDI